MFDPVSLAIQGGLALASGALSKKTSKQGTPGGVEIITLPQYSFTEPRLRLTSDFISDQLSSIGQGRFPQYFENQIPLIRRSLERPLAIRYMGRKGDRAGSILDQVRSAGAATGVGAKATMANTNKALARFEEQSRAIDEFIAEQGIDTTRSLIPTLLQSSSYLPQGPSSTVVGFPGTPPQGSAISDALGALAGNQTFMDNLTGGARALIDSFGGSLGTGASGGGFYDVFTGPGGVQFSPSAPPAGYTYSSGYSSSPARSQAITTPTTIGSLYNPVGIYPVTRPGVMPNVSYDVNDPWLMA